MEQPAKPAGLTTRSSLRSRAKSRVASDAGVPEAEVATEPATSNHDNETPSPRSRESLAVSLRAARSSLESDVGTGQVALLALAPWAPRALLEDVAVAASIASFFHPNDATTVLSPRMNARLGAVLIVDVSGECERAWTAGLGD